MVFKWFLVSCFVALTTGQTVYDAYFAQPITESRRSFLNGTNNNGIGSNNVTNVIGIRGLMNNVSSLDLGTVDVFNQCTITVQPCTHYEGRRVDGTCVNPRYPSRGGTRSPFLRLLPPRFGLGNTLRPARDGSELPSSRLLRTKILSDGFVVDHHFSTLATHVLLFAAADIGDLMYLLRYAVTSPCCIANNIPNRADPQCISIEVPRSDPYLRDSGVTCLNLTRQETYQDNLCIPQTLPPAKYNRNTPLQDLSVIYGYTNARGQRSRTFEGGQLKTAPGKDGVLRPLPTSTNCFGNLPPLETACYEFGDDFDGNLLVGITLTAFWFYKEHNRLASELARINPCWDDQQLYDAARYINIAEYQYILFYELMAEILGRENALHSGVIFDTHGFVNDFDDKHKPGVFHEFNVGFRWFHTFQDARTDIYSNKGDYLGTRTTVDDELRSGIFENNGTEADLTQGSFRQPSARFDRIMDPDLAERLYGIKQQEADLPSIDISRSRDQGLAPYNEYRKLCGYPVAHEWEDFHDTIDPDVVEQLRRIYEDEDDVDYMAALYAERLIKGGYVPPTLYCIMVHQLRSWRKSDRYFFEHGDLPASLTLPQLNEIRKTSIARIVCDNGINVDEIQPKGFFRPHKGNEITNCKNIRKMDLSKWRDPQCQKLSNTDDHDDEQTRTPNPLN